MLLHMRMWGVLLTYEDVGCVLTYEDVGCVVTYDVM